MHNIHITERRVISSLEIWVCFYPLIHSPRFLEANIQETKLLPIFVIECRRKLEPRDKKKAIGTRVRHIKTRDSVRNIHHTYTHTDIYMSN